MRSQPIPHPFRWDDPGITVELYSVCVTGFRKVQMTNARPPSPTRTISSYDLRAPEVILGADYNVKVDIWALGCMTFELLTGSTLFIPQAGQSIEDEHLAKMAQMTGESFSEKILAKFRKRNEHFDESGKLLRIEQLSLMTLESAMIDHGLPEVEAAAAAAFIYACLHLNSEEQSSTSGLLKHPWMECAYMYCQC
ncbi:kinase-like domain-containing protein [Suillus subalutaceus]|uniref:kinase-like domain-containing protein n=1 Tax=Suillus subalutaceus TaxID=48586 RepID=UPI001B86583B|nr:kinase-like domain-containing protein [Suillus subalutaceus]KAG1841213.1 kinase-like domain-containing protein [Suillus subalutaceus]